MVTYIKSDVRNIYIELENELAPELYPNLGTTWQDYLDNLFVKLSDEQVAFKNEHPKAKVHEVWNMELDPVHVRNLDDAKNEKKSSKRKINEKVVRAMQSYRFFEFSERLKNKCLEYGCILIRSNEAYTSKTNSFNGEVFNVGSRKRFTYDGIYVDRDINGARNILLRAMRDSSACGCNAIG